MSSSPFIYKIINPVIKTILNSPAHGIISRRIMIISFKGRKSGKEYSTPLSYYRRDAETVFCFTDGNWSKNLKDGAEVTLKMGDEVHKGFALVEPQDENKVEVMRNYFIAVPSDAKFYGVKISKDGEPDRGDVTYATRVVVMIRIKLAS